jgi:hypothetical protein
MVGITHHVSAAKANPFPLSELQSSKGVLG